KKKKAPAEGYLQPGLATGRVNSLRGQFKRFDWRQWLRHDCCLMMPPTPSEAGGERNKSGADDKDAHGLGSLFCAPELPFLINHSQPNFVPARSRAFKKRAHCRPSCKLCILLCTASLDNGCPGVPRT